MRVVVVTPPDPIVSLDEAKRHLRVDHDDENAYVESLIAVATAWLDAPAGWLGRALGEQVLEVRYAAWPRPLRLPYLPEIEITAITYVDPAGAAQILPLSGGAVPYAGLPAVRGRDGDVRIRYRAGYAKAQDGKSTVPAPIRHAILLMVSHLFNNRDAVTTTAAQPATLPLGVEALLGPYRVWSI